MPDKKGHLYTSMLLASDVAAVLLACCLSYLVYARLSPYSNGNPKNYLTTVPFIVVVWPVIFKEFNLYKPKRDGSMLREVWDIIRASLFGALVLYASVFFYHGMNYSRLIIGLFIIISAGVSTLFRITARIMLRYIRKKGYNSQSILIIGAGDLGKSVAEKISKNTWTGFKIVGYLDDHKPKGSIVENAEVLGRLKDVNEVISEKHVDQVFIALPIEAHRKTAWLMNELTYNTVDIKIVPDIFQMITLNAGVVVLDGIPFINISETLVQGWHKIFKRLFDIIFSLLILLIMSPVMIVLAILIKATSPGPIIYKQERVGINGNVFLMFKFRSMAADAESETGAVWASKKDARRTKLGAFMRNTSLDELPQFFNVLTGDMSVVGPRPERPVFVQKFKSDIRGYMLRHKVKSGITGWAQINGRVNISIEKRIEYDLYYIEHWSLWLDLKIIFLTMFKVAICQNAY